MNLEQQRARHAYGTVTAVPSGARKQFLSLARQLPSRFQINGLLASWAALLGDHKNVAHRMVLDASTAHLRELGLCGGGTHQQVFEAWLGLGVASAALSGSQMRSLTAEAIAYSNWLKKASEACLGGEDGEAGIGNAEAGGEAPKAEPEGASS